MSATAVDGHGELVEQLDLLVREAVRRQGVDPQRDAPVVRRIAEGVVRDHDERSLTGGPLHDVIGDGRATVGPRCQPGELHRAEAGSSRSRRGAVGTVAGTASTTPDHGPFPTLLWAATRNR